MAALWNQFVGTLNYKAPKYVEVRSLNIGLLSKLPLLLTFLYIGVYQILWRSRHLSKSVPSGFGRLQLQRPTEKHCNPNHDGCNANFTVIPQLSYCVPRGQGKASKESEESGSGKLPCKYMDEKQMNRVGFQHQTIMVPTRVTTSRQQPTGNCGSDATKECKNVYEVNTDAEESEYVADIERFTLLIETAFTLPADDVAKAVLSHGASNDFPGYWEVCEDVTHHKSCHLEKIKCLGGDCDGNSPTERRLRGSEDRAGAAREESAQARRLQAEARRLGGGGRLEFFGLPFGDVVSMGSLLKMAGVDLDRDTDVKGEARRSTGIALQIDVHYDNERKFRWPPWATHKEDIKYVYRVSKLPFQTYKEVAQQVQDDGSRILVDTHGIFVNVNIEGKILYWDITQLLLILTTALSLMAGAQAGVHFWAANCWRFKEEYKEAKTDKSRNFDKDDKLFGFLPVPFSDEMHYATWASYSRRPKEFTKHLRALDGDTLRCAGDLLMTTHRILSKEHGVDFVKKEEEKWLAEEAKDDKYQEAPTSSLGAAGVEQVAEVASQPLIS